MNEEECLALKKDCKCKELEAEVKHLIEAYYIMQLDLQLSEMALAQAEESLKKIEIILMEKKKPLTTHR